MNITTPLDENSRPGSDRSISLEQSRSLESQKKQLYKAAKNMESLFLYQLLKTMRQTIPETELSDTFGSGGGLGKDIYTQMFDQELATKMAGAGTKSIADMLYASLEKVLEQQYNGEKSQEPAGINEILPGNKYVEIKNQESAEVESAGKNKSKTSYLELSENYGRIIKEAANKYKLSPSLIAAVIKAESNGNPEAVSSAGAKGLMQLIDTTAADMGVTDVFDPQENINGGAKYLRNLLDRFGDVKIALAAYNAGPEAVKRYGGIPPYRETINYVNSVMEKLSEETSSRQ